MSSWFSCADASTVVFGLQHNHNFGVNSMPTPNGWLRKDNTTIYFLSLGNNHLELM